MWQRVGLLELQTVLSSLVQFLPRFVRRRLNTFHRGHATPMWSFHWTGRKRRMCLILRAVGAASAAASHSFSLDANLTLLLKSLNCDSFFFFFFIWILCWRSFAFMWVNSKGECQPFSESPNEASPCENKHYIIYYKRHYYCSSQARRPSPNPTDLNLSFWKELALPFKGLNASNVSVQNIADNHSHCT